MNDKILLEQIKFTLDVGNIYYRSRDRTFRWKVSNIKEFNNVIIPLLIAYPLITQKKFISNYLKVSLKSLIVKTIYPLKVYKKL
jgi:hypothetical protein